MIRFLCGVALTMMIIPLSAFKGKDSDLRIYTVPKEAPRESEDAPALQVAETAQGGLSWQVPEGWAEDPAPGMMQLVSITVSQSDGDDVDTKASIVVLGGAAGGTIANVNRWRDQVGLPPQEGAEIEASAQQLDTAFGPAPWFEIIGGEKAIMTAIIQDGGRSIFVKIMGGTQTVKDNKEKFLDFTKSVHGANGS